MAGDVRPLWLILRTDLEAKGLSIRGFARQLAAESTSQTFDSWHRLVRRAVSDGSEYAPSKTTAELFARLLDQPAERYFRPQRRQTLRERNAELERQVEELQAEIERLRQGREGAA